MPRPQLYRLRSRTDREIIREVEPGAVYVDRETGEEFSVVGKVLPLGPSEGRLPWAVENLRLCGCSLEQLAAKDVPDCPTCGGRLPAIGGQSSAHPRGCIDAGPDGTPAVPGGVRGG